MKTGGYQIFDLSSTPFVTGVSSIKVGAYEILEGTRKAILVSGLTVDGIEYGDSFVDFAVSNSNYVGRIHGKIITVGNSGDGNDPITITNEEE